MTDKSWETHKPEKLNRPITSKAAWFKSGSGRLRRSLSAYAPQHVELACLVPPRIHFAEDSVYPPCPSLGRMCCFSRFSRLMKSTSYVLSVGVRIPTPPASTISHWPGAPVKGYARISLRRGLWPLQLLLPGSSAERQFRENE
jgi:hypothetical protein